MKKKSPINLYEPSRQSLSLGGLLNRGIISVSHFGVAVESVSMVRIELLLSLQTIYQIGSRNKVTANGNQHIGVFLGFLLNVRNHATCLNETSLPDVSEEVVVSSKALQI